MATEHAHARLIRKYFDACNAADYDALMSCFTADAIHYFPPGLPDIPWRTVDVIARVFDQAFSICYPESTLATSAQTSSLGTDSVSASHVDRRVISISTRADADRQDREYWLNASEEMRWQAVELQRMMPMLMELPQDFSEFLKLLNANCGVRRR